MMISEYHPAEKCPCRKKHTASKGSAELCANCGVSLLCPTAQPGCPRCIVHDLSLLRHWIEVLKGHAPRAVTVSN